MVRPMRTLDKFAAEFVHICAYIEKKEPQDVTSRYIFIKQEALKKLLDHNKYEEATTKLDLWRSLHWIECEPNRFTKKMTKDSQQFRAVVINRDVYKKLKQIICGTQLIFTTL